MEAEDVDGLADRGLWDGNHQEPVDPGWHETNNLWGGVSDLHASTTDMHANTPYLRPGSVPSGDVPSGQIPTNDLWADVPDLFRQQE